MDVNNDNQSFDFGIESTMEYGAGDTKLVKDLFSDGVNANPDDIKDIKDDDGDANKNPKDTTDTNDDGGSANPADDDLTNFLLGDDNADEGKTGNDDVDPDLNKPADTNDLGDDGDNNAGGDDDNKPGVEIEFNALARELAQLGVFSELAEDANIESGEQFLQKFQEEKKKGAIEIVQNFIGKFGQDYQDAFDSIFVKGVHPRDYYGTFNQIDSFSNIDLSDENNQEYVVKETLKDQGWEPEDISKEIEKLKEYGDLETVSQRYHKVLVKKEQNKLKEQEQEAQLRHQQKAEEKQLYVNNVVRVLEEKIKEKSFDGIPINSDLANELQDFLLVDKWKTESGDTLTDFDRTILELKRPENHANKVKIALLLKLLEKDPTLSTIKKSGVSKQTSELFRSVARQTTSNNRNSGGTNKSTSWFK